MSSPADDARAGHGSLIENLRGLPPVLWILFAGAFVNRLGTFVMPFLVLYLTDQGYSAAKAGLVVGLYGVGNFIASFIGGHLADHIGRRRTIMVSMFSTAAVMLALSQAQGLVVLGGLTLCLGVCADMFRPAATALVIDLCTPSQQLTATAVFRMVVNLGFAGGGMVAGLLVRSSYTWLFIGDAATSVLFGLIALFGLPNGARHAAPAGQTGHWLPTALSDRRVVQFLIAQLAVTTVLMQLDSTLPLHVRDAGHSASTYGFLVSVNGTLIMILEVALTVVTQRFPERHVMAAGYVLTGIGFGLTALAMSPPAIGLTIAIWTLGEMISSPVSGVYLAKLAPAHLRGRYMGLLNATWSLALVLGPTLGTLVYSHSEALLWAGCAALGVIAMLLVLV